MRNVRGTRIESFVIRREARRLVEQHFPDIWHSSVRPRFNPRDFQQSNGGISIFPYAESDLALTVRLMPFISDEISTASLRAYLYRIFEGTSADNKMRALYGLAMLHEPVLLHLQNYAMLTDISVRDMAYIALGFAALGETATATAMFNQRIAPHIQRVAPFYRVSAGESREDILDATSVVSLLAAQLGMPQADGLNRYVARYRTGDLLIMLERLTFISREIVNYPAGRASITYSFFGREVTRDVSRGRSYTLRIPTQNMHEFELISVSGPVGAVSIVRTPLEDMGLVENEIIIRREFFRAGEEVSRTTFEQGDLVRVELTVDFPATAVGGSYVITDFLPAGLVHVPGISRLHVGQRSGDSWSWTWRHPAIEGQRIMITDSSIRQGERVYAYYARVINPGTFTAEGTMVQSLGARDYMSVGENAVIVIND